MNELSKPAQALMASLWGVSPGMVLTFSNVESRPSPQLAHALAELVAAKLVERYLPDTGVLSIGFRLKEGVDATAYQKPLTFVSRHGNIPMTVPNTPVAISA